MTRRPLGAFAAVMAAVVGAVGPASSPAAAQAGYPPGPCAATVNVGVAGVVRIGAVLDVVLTPICSWTPGLPVTVTVNGRVVATKLAGLSGSVSVNVTVLSAVTLSIDDPVLVPATCGTNMITGVGESSVAAGMVTQSVAFTLDCTQVLPATESRGLLAFTGAAVVRLAAIALSVVMLGALLVVAARRRRSGPPASESLGTATPS